MDETADLDELLRGFRKALHARNAIGCPAQFWHDQRAIDGWEHSAMTWSKSVNAWWYAYLDFGGSRRRIAAIEAAFWRKAGGRKRFR